MARKRKTGESTDAGESTDDVVVIKKYANRRLYNTTTSSYVTLDNLCQMVKDGKDFVVYDAKTGDDITRSVLTQIIVEEEAKGQNLLPIGFLRQLIGFYGDNLQTVVPRYLEDAMSAFTQNQEQTRAYMTEALGGMFKFANFEDMARQNMTLMERAMGAFVPGKGFGGGASHTEKKAEPSQTEPRQAQPAQPAPRASDPAIDALRQQVDMLQRKLEQLSDDARDKK